MTGELFLPRIIFRQPRRIPRLPKNKSTGAAFSSDYFDSDQYRYAAALGWVRCFSIAVGEQRGDFLLSSGMVWKTTEVEVRGLVGSRVRLPEGVL